MIGKLATSLPWLQKLDADTVDLFVELIQRARNEPNGQKWLQEALRRALNEPGTERVTIEVADP